MISRPLDTTDSSLEHPQKLLSYPIYSKSGTSLSLSNFIYHVIQNKSS